jgi:hypothetical protein
MIMMLYVGMAQPCSPGIGFELSRPHAKRRCAAVQSLRAAYSFDDLASAQQEAFRVSK